MLSALAVSAVGALFLVNQEVGALDKRLRDLNAQIDADYRALHVLRAEYSHLTQPHRLQVLAERHLALRPLKGEQLVRLTPNSSATQPLFVMRGADRDQQPSARRTADEPLTTPTSHPAIAAAPAERRRTVTIEVLPATAPVQDDRRPLDTVVDLMAELFAVADYGRR